MHLPPLIWKENAISPQIKNFSQIKSNHKMRTYLANRKRKSMKNSKPMT